MREGIDYSRGGFPGSGPLKAAGKDFCVRYVVSDLSPGGRGITAAEYQELRSGGIDVAVVWEGTEARMLDGFAAGQWDARNAESNIANAGLPASIPVYFAADWDATPADQAAIDTYLRGAASVLGAGRVGIYGGFWIVARCAANKTAAFYWQTSAWSGGQWFAGNHLEQYAYNLYINNVNCDATRALQPNFGQANPPAVPPPPPAPTPVPEPPQPEPTGPSYPTPTLPDWWQAEKKLGFPTNRHVGEALWAASRGKSTVIRDTEQRVVASPKGRRAGPLLKKGDVILRERILTAADGSQWVILRAGGKGKEGARVLHADLQDAPEFPGKKG